MITSAQCRAARALLDITQRELAEAAGLGESTVRDFEADRRTPYADSLALMRSAFEKSGVEFMGEGETSDKGGPGVRLRATTTKSKGRRPSKR